MSSIFVRGGVTTRIHVSIVHELIRNSPELMRNLSHVFFDKRCLRISKCVFFDCESVLIVNRPSCILMEGYIMKNGMSSANTKLGLHAPRLWRVRMTHCVIIIISHSTYLPLHTVIKDFRLINYPTSNERHILYLIIFFFFQKTTGRLFLHNMRLLQSSTHGRYLEEGHFPFRSKYLWYGHEPI